MICASTSGKVLSVGPAPDSKGGVATVLKTYAGNMERFRLIVTYRETCVAGKLWLAIAGVLRMIGLMLAGGIRIVHVHASSETSFRRKAIFVRIAHVFRRKIIVHLHAGDLATYFDRHPHTVARTLRRADLIICVSEYMRGILAERGFRDNVTVLYNPVRLPERNPLQKPDKPDSLSILFLGAIVDYKGIFDLTEHIASHRDGFPAGTKLHIAGDGDRQRLERIIREGGISDLVVYEGWADDNTKAALLGDADIYVQPSRMEALGISIIEAMGYGLPIVATAVGGIPELVTDGYNGYLVSPGDMAGLSAYIRRLAANPGERRSMGMRSAEMATRFTPENIMKELENIYKELSER